MNEQDIIKKMRADNFVKNNGVVLRAINIGRKSYNRLSSLCGALAPEIEKAEFTDCINYLSESKYIILRRCDNKQPANFSDNEIVDLEAKVSPEGIQLLAGMISDPCVRA
ncbi:MAG: type VI secretion protein [Oscillospiraceae bacterium]|nr:type VI secretion protein [Oscillospiraceae bacterium]